MDPRREAQRAAALDLCRRGGTFVATVRSDCMAPGIPDGARVRIRVCSPEAIRPGEVVLLVDGGPPVLHRYLGAVPTARGAALLCKGDRRRRPDPPWRPECLVGRAEAILPPDASDWRDPPPMRGGALACARWGARLCLWLGRTAAPPEARTHLHGLGADWSLHCCGFPVHALVHPEACRAPDAAPAPGGRIRVERDDAVPEAGQSGIREEGRVWHFSHAGLRVTVDRARRTVHVRARDAVRARAGLRGAFRILAGDVATEEGGVCLHASCVRVGDAAYVFAGPSGAGKSSAAAAFPPADRLDADMVLLLPDGPGFRRRAWSPVPEAQTHAGASEAAPAVKAILFPERGDAFCLTRLDGAEALGRCLHLPPSASPAAGADYLANAARLSARIPCYRLAWVLETPLPSLLAQAIPAPE